MCQVGCILLGMVAVAAGKFLIPGSGIGVVSIELGSGDGDGRV
jgi:hypothetical protein